MYHIRGRLRLRRSWGRRMVQHVVHVGELHRAPIHGRVMRTQLREGWLPVLTVVRGLLLWSRHARIVSRSTLEGSVHAVLRGPLALARRGGEGRSGRARWRGVEVVDQNENRGMLLVGTRARARVALNHALRSKEGLDLLAQFSDAVVLPHPVWPLGAKSKTLQPETDASLASTLFIRLLIAFLPSNPTGVAARLSTNGAFWLGRSGLLLGSGLLGYRGDGFAWAGRSVRHVCRLSRTSVE